MYKLQMLQVTSTLTNVFFFAKTTLTNVTSEIARTVVLFLACVMTVLPFRGGHLGFLFTRDFGY